MQSLPQTEGPTPSLSRDQAPAPHNVLPRPATSGTTHACQSNENRNYRYFTNGSLSWSRSNIGCQDRLEPQEISPLVPSSSVNSSTETVLASQTPEYE